ncbi:RecA-like DNA recombinase [Gordonia phage Archimedes]|uniref:RecA-like DNA recombinase n=1 Tax=Gordonia phage Archimedes TaxID=2759389 RepID=A0A7L7SHN9_9CAUD|nr:Sak4-like ssDNA annealing protein [Gordonia phage Archimedes]QOC55731.1 RecA-like DNA recombinase [Gordonia phage Archimedes]
MPKMGADASVKPTADPKPARRKTETEEAVDQSIKQSTDAWFTTLSDTKEYVKAVFYGREGTGKSTAAATASQNGRVLIVNSEGGLKKAALRQHGVNTDNVAVWPNPETDEQITARSLEELHERILSALTDDPDAFYAVVIDSLTEVHHLLREQATDQRVAKSRVEVDPDFIDRDDYGKMTSQLRKLIRRFRDLPCHVVFIALEKDDEDAKEYRPALTPALCTDVLGYADVVARYASPDTTFRARFKGTDRIRAKDRFDMLPATLPEPSFVRIEQYVSGELDAKQDTLLGAMLESDRERQEAADAEKAEKEAKRAAAKKAPAKRAPRKAAAKPAAETPESETSESAE